jgi:dUTP pyrophosphatase
VPLPSPPPSVVPVRTDTIIITQPGALPAETTPDTAAAIASPPRPSCRVLIDQQEWVRALAQCIEEGQAGNALASRRAAEILSTGTGSVPRDDATAAQLYEQAAKGGDPEAQFVVAGRVERTDPSQATAYYRAAADRNVVKAFPHIARRLDQGLGTAVDAEGAAGWYRRAAAAGDVASQRRLAELFAEGRGVKRDDRAAADWYLRAADPVPIRRLDPELPLPRQMRSGDAAVDLAARVDVTLAPGERSLVPTGFAVAIPHGWCGLILPRSGLALDHGLTVLNTPGLIDSGYRGELQVILFNSGIDKVTVERGRRIAQLLVLPVPEFSFDEVGELPPSIDERGEQGFGSSG